MKILNLTQHSPTEDQIAAGVADPDDTVARNRALNVAASDLVGPNVQDIIHNRIADLVEIVLQHGLDHPVWDGRVMIGGLPVLTASLAVTLAKIGCSPVYAVTDRVSVESVQADGSVRKTSEFKHVGFVPAIL